jgi:inhibitor of cysteine peptidase
MVRYRFLRTASAVTLAAMLSPMLAGAQQPGRFSDVRAQTRYATAINELAADGVLEGYADKTFKPGNRINRAEFLKIVIEAAFTDAEIDDLLSRVRLASFPDVDSEAWYARYVQFAMAKGIVSGYPDGTFKPDDDVNFVEASKILALAYGQKAQGGGDWYRPYVKALDGSKAIPPTVEKLDAALKRGEMAEMMWRVAKKKMNEEAQGYLNVKYASTTVNFASDDVQRAGSCEDLAAVAEEARGDQESTYYYRNGVMEGDAVAAPAPATGAKAANQSAGDDGYSRTNVQVEGVDEADIVKADGEHLYMVRGQTVKIVRAKPAASMKEIATINLAELNISPSELYVDGNILVVVGSSWTNVGRPRPMPLPMMEKMIAPDSYWNPGISKTDVRIYDVSDASSPTLVRAVAFEGSSVATRKIEDKVYLVLQQPMRWVYPMLRNEEGLLPVYDDSASKLKDEPVARCGNVAILPHVEQPEYMTVAVIPTADPDGEIKKEVVLGSAQNVYMSLQNLYVATTQWNYVWDTAGSESNETTNLFRFRVLPDGIAMQAKGSVDGTILDQFSMDEHENEFRITTTEHRWSNDGSDRSTNNLYVLNASLETVGKIEDIAPGETIYSTRFMGDRAYMVTFKKVDPFFVIDVSDGRYPKILGKLKIPGYSDYLHPYDENHVIGFGKEAVEAKEGDFAWYQGMKVAVFDVTDVADPKELHKLTIGDRGTDSAVLWNHKALLFEKDRDLLAFPVSIAKLTDAQKQQNEGSAYGSPVFQGAQVYDFNLKDGFKLRGQITHYDADAFLKAGDTYYGYGRDVERIVRVGDSLYTLSQYGVAAHAEETVKRQGMLIFSDK